MKCKFKDWIPKELSSDVVYRFQCAVSAVKVNVKKRAKPNNSSVADHLLFRNHSASYHDFIILTRENKKLLNRSITSVIISLLERYLLLIVAMLFLLNGLFIKPFAVSSL